MEVSPISQEAAPHTADPDKSSVGTPVDMSHGRDGVNVTLLPETLAPSGSPTNGTVTVGSATYRPVSVASTLIGTHTSSSVQVVPPSVENSKPGMPFVTRTSTAPSANR